MPSFPGRHEMADHLQAQGAQYGIQFHFPDRLSNSHRALLASEFARDQGRFGQFHPAVFYRYFTCGEDIGSWDVLRLAAEQAELDGDRMVRAVESGRYDARLDEAHQLGSAFGVDGTPTFIINRRYKIVGAQPYELIFKALRQVLESSS